MDREQQPLLQQEGCHPILRDSDLDISEQAGWRIDGPLSVKLTSKKPVVEQPRRPVLGGIVERKPSRNVAPPTSPLEDELAKLQTGQPDTLSDIKKEVNRDNTAALASMTPDEIREEQAWIKETLSPETMEFLKRRAQK